MKVFHTRCIGGCAPLCFNQNSKCRKVLLKLYNMAVNETWFILVMYAFWCTDRDVATVSMFVFFLWMLLSLITLRLCRKKKKINGLREGDEESYKRMDMQEKCRVGNHAETTVPTSRWENQKWSMFNAVETCRRLSEWLARHCKSNNVAQFKIYQHKSELQWMASIQFEIANDFKQRNGPVAVL